MRFLLEALNWIFILYAITIPVVIIGISIRSGIGQGLQFLVLPIMILYFLILFWWTYNLSKYMSASAEAIRSAEKYFILLQVLCLYFLVVLPLIVLTVHLIWNRVTRPSPLENVGVHCFTFLISSGMFLSVIGIVLGIRYLNKRNNIISTDHTGRV